MEDKCKINEDVSKDDEPSQQEQEMSERARLIKNRFNRDAEREILRKEADERKRLEDEKEEALRQAQEEIQRKKYEFLKGREGPQIKQEEVSERARLVQERFSRDAEREALRKMHEEEENRIEAEQLARQQMIVEDVETQDKDRQLRAVLIQNRDNRDAERQILREKAEAKEREQDMLILEKQREIAQSIEAKDQNKAERAFLVQNRENHDAAREIMRQEAEERQKRETEVH